MICGRVREGHNATGRDRACTRRDPTGSDVYRCLLHQLSTRAGRPWSRGARARLGDNLSLNPYTVTQMQRVLILIVLNEALWWATLPRGRS